MLRFLASLFRKRAIIDAQQREIVRLANENADLRRRLFARYTRCRIASRATR
jgi:hypothetical protein